MLLNITMDDTNDFKKDVIDRSFSVPVIVDFWAPWCAPCRILSPILEKLHSLHQKEWDLVKVNVDAHQDLGIEYGVTSVPSVKLFFNGNILSEFSGTMPGYLIEDWLKKTLPSRSFGALQHARELLADHHERKAEELLDEILVEEPDSKEAKALLAGTLVFNNPAKAEELVHGIEPVGSLGEYAEAVGIISKAMTRFIDPGELSDSPAKEPVLHAITALYGSDLEVALENLMESLKVDKNYLDGFVKDLCIAIFKYLGEENDLTKKYRRILGMVLS